MNFFIEFFIIYYSFNFLEEVSGFDFLNITYGRYLLLFNLGFGISHNVSELINLFSRYKCECYTCFTCPTCSSYPVYIVFIIIRHIIVENRFNVFNVNSSCCNICCYQDLYISRSELGHDTVPLPLAHVSMKTVCSISSNLEVTYKFVDSSFSVTKYKR